MSNTDPNPDELETQVLWNRLHATADEMFETAKRLAFSLSIRSGGDASSAVLTPDGDAIGLSNKSIPVFSGALARTTRIVLEDHFPPSSLEPGDVVVTNDPWIGAGHLSDFLVLNPVFQGEELIGITAMFGHTDDVGGNPGGWSTDAETVFEEGLLLPPTKFYEAGERNDAVADIVRNNVRLPDEALGDLEALRSGTTVAEDRLQEVVEGYGYETFTRVTDEILDRSERKLREEIAALPDATHSAAMDFEVDDYELTIAVDVTIDGDDLYVDFDGTSDQVPAGINCPFGNVRSVTAYIVKCMLVPDLLNAEGIFRPIHVSAPDGSILDADRPIATMARHTTYSRVEDVLTRALGQAVPEAAVPEMGGIQLSSFSGMDADGNQFYSVAGTQSGFPPRAGLDGIPGVFHPYNGAITPVEVWEQYSPLRWVETTLVPDTEGAGKYRSSPAMKTTIHNPMDVPVGFDVTSDRGDQDPAGFRGGHSGRRADLTSSDGDGEPPVNGTGTLGPGETQSLISATSGGYGDPTERDPSRIEDDIRKGFVSERRAREVYDYEPDG
jgi:N-methylhydantoinase B/oxoprolinase/acetone carboxylase alpha subunit